MKHGFRPKRTIPAEETQRFYKQFAASKLEDCHSVVADGTLLVSKWLWNQLREKEPSFSIDVPKNDLVYARVLGQRVIVSDRLPYKTRFPSKRQQRRATFRRHGKVKPQRSQDISGCAQRGRAPFASAMSFYTDIRFQTNIIY